MERISTSLTYACMSNVSDKSLVGEQIQRQWCTDSTLAFAKAWAAACDSTESATIYVPKGRYMLGSVAFKGECKSSDITLRIDAKAQNVDDGFNT
ncbi:hypothetical protein CUMW_277450 [Citrus unshiu]|uniref:Pectate lyase superfamily protein domain-containing protein n=1 Tax=Citrus unshiu TaxID=55188 RepID=A0A2H5N4L9_CITUN|nr:hypothetical protein CUMW_277450 [Citrus unshiu]